MMVTAWHGAPAAPPAPEAPARAVEPAVDIEAVLPGLLTQVVVKHRCALDLPAGSVRLDLDRGDDTDQQRFSRLLITATPSGRGSHRQSPPAETMAEARWRAHQLRLLRAAVAQAVDLIVYLPEGISALRSLLEPSVASDRYARLRPSPTQLDLAARCLHDAGALDPALDHAVLPLALPGRVRGPWSIGQAVEPVAACWLAESRAGADTPAYRVALSQAREAGRAQLGERTGSVALVLVDAHGRWQVVDDPLGPAPLATQDAGKMQGQAVPAGGLQLASPAGT